MKFSFLGNALLFAIFCTVSVAAQSTNDEWTGFYVGGYVGVTNARVSANTSTVFDSSGYFDPTSVPAINSAGARRFNSNGFTGGGQFGYTKQFGRVVVGAEADFGAQRIDAEDTVTADYPCCASNFTIDQAVESDWLFTARPKVGVAAGKALVYATGGVAVTNLKYAGLFTDTDSDAIESAEFDTTRTGYTVGGGVELKVSRRWSVKGEYLFADFGRESVTSNNLTTEFIGGDVLNLGIAQTDYPENTFTRSARLKTHSVRFGINYRF